MGSGSSPKADAFHSLFWPLVCEQSERDSERYEAWQKQRADASGEAVSTIDKYRLNLALHDEYREQNAQHPALYAAQKRQGPPSAMRISADLIMARLNLADAEKVPA